jgi:UDP-4-amino-4,6-dideoxy-N-acetyl-beta-L-altrosamine N-acetyltransferase
MKEVHLELKDVVSIESGVASLLRTWRNSDDVRKQMVSDHIISAEEHGKWLDSFRGNPAKRGWVVYWNNKPAGFMQLTEIDHAAGTAEWGLYIGEANLRGRGIGKNALLRLLELGFGELGLRKLTTKVLEGNKTALSLYRSVGFQEEGKRTPLLRDGKKTEAVVMSMTDDAWRN